MYNRNKSKTIKQNFPAKLTFDREATLIATNNSLSRVYKRVRIK
jgi:hypothetical protein